jgi:hypothetical protein
MNRDLYCWITKTRKGKFRPKIGEPIPDDDDSFMNVVAQGDICITEEEAQKFLKENAPENAKVYLTPITPAPLGFTWLSDFKDLDKQP